MKVHVLEHRQKDHVVEHMQKDILVEYSKQVFTKVGNFLQKLVISYKSVSNL